MSFVVRRSSLLDDDLRRFCRSFLLFSVRSLPLRSLLLRSSALDEDPRLPLRLPLCLLSRRSSLSRVFLSLLRSRSRLSLLSRRRSRFFSLSRSLSLSLTLSLRLSRSSLSLSLSLSFSLSLSLSFLSFSFSRSTLRFSIRSGVDSRRSRDVDRPRLLDLQGFEIVFTSLIIKKLQPA